MKILLEGLSNDLVSVDEDAHLLKHSVDIGVHSAFASFVHHYHARAALLDILTDLLELLGSEWHLGATKQEQVSLSHALESQLILVNITLNRKMSVQRFKTKRSLPCSGS